MIQLFCLEVIGHPPLVEKSCSSPLNSPGPSLIVSMNEMSQNVTSFSIYRLYFQDISLILDNVLSHRRIALGPCWFLNESATLLEKQTLSTDNL